MPAAMTGTAPAAGSPAGDRGFLNAAARACPASGSSCQADGYPVCPGNHLGSSPGRRGLPARRRRGLFAVPDLAIGDDRHLAPYVRCLRRCVHVGLAGDFDEARQQLFGPPYQMDVTALGPGDDGRIRVHVGEQQNRHEVGWLLSVPRYGPLWGRDIFRRSRRAWSGRRPGPPGPPCGVSEEPPADPSGPRARRRGCGGARRGCGPGAPARPEAQESGLPGLTRGAPAPPPRRCRQTSA